MHDDYEGPAQPSLAKKLSEMHPEMRMDVRLDSFGTGPDSDKSYLKERHARLKKEIEAGEDELADWDPEEIVARAKKSLTAELAKKRADLMSCEAEMDAAGVDYDGKDGKKDDDDEDEDSSDGEVVAEGNPYSVMKRGSNFVIENTETGHVKGRHSSKKKAMRQFRLLEGIEHGWKPTGAAAKD